MQRMRKFPKELMITDVEITNYHRAYSSVSMTGAQYRHDSGIQWFKGKVTIKAYGFNNVRKLNGFLASLRGRYNAFELPLSGAYANRDLASNPVLTGTHDVGSDKIAMHHTAGDISMGSVFTVPNDTKLYTLLDDIDGDGTYSLVPSLKRNQQNLAVANFKNPVITAILDGNETTIKHGDGGLLSEVTISFTELIA